MRPDGQEAEIQQVKPGVILPGHPVLRPPPWDVKWSLEKVGHSSPEDACKGKHASVHVAHM